MSGKEQGLARLGDIIDVEVDPRDDTIDQLERQVAKLRGELSDTRHELARVREDSNRALTALRTQLSPLYRALQRVFGELDDAGVRDDLPAAAASAPAPTGPTADPRWASWKQKMPGRPAEVIDLLLLHGEMNRNQLMAAMHVGKDVVRVTISKLNVAGLINKNGGKFSLKAL